MLENSLTFTDSFAAYDLKNYQAGMGDHMLSQFGYAIMFVMPPEQTHLAEQLV